MKVTECSWYIVPWNLWERKNWQCECKAGSTIVDATSFVWYGYTSCLSPGRWGCDSKCVNFKHNLWIDILFINAMLPCNECQRTPHWYIFNIGSADGLAPPGHDLNQCWPRFPIYGVARPQRVKRNIIKLNVCTMTFVVLTLGDINVQKWKIAKFH